MTRYPKNGKGSKWTVAELKNIPSSWKGDTLSEGQGLIGEVRLSKNEQVSVRYKYAFKWEGKVTWFSCGTFPTNDIASIRKARDDAYEKIRVGIDPRKQKLVDRIQAQQQIDSVLINEAKLKSENLAVQDLFDTWIRDGVKRADGNKYIIQAFAKHILPFIGSTTIRTLTEHDLRSIYRKIILKGHQTRALEISKDVGQMFKWASLRQPWIQLMINGDPSKLVDIKLLLTSDYTKERDRILNDTEIWELDNRFKSTALTYIQAEIKYGIERPLKREVQLAMWICLSTLSRIGELLKSEWCHVNFLAKIWFIPKENTKGQKGKKRDHLVYLSDFALEVFRELHSITGNSRWVFPATYNDSHVCVKSASKQIGDRQVMFKSRTKKLKYRVENNSLVLGDREWTPHDLRRTGATLMQRLKVSRDVINLCQNHVIGSKVDRHYLLHDYAEEKREAWQKLGTELNRILYAANVVHLKMA